MTRNYSRRQAMGGGIAILAAPGIVRAQASASDPVEKALGGLVAAGRLPGAAWEVRQHGKILSAGAVGRMALDGAAMRSDAPFQIMSISKVYIAVAVMTLVEQRKLDLSAHLYDYLPEFGDGWMLDGRDGPRRTLIRPPRPITLTDILTHGSGLPDAPPVLSRYATKMRYSLAEAAGIMSQQPLLHPPGSRQLYSNVGIAMAARVVEKISGQPYDAFVAETVFRRLHLKQSSFRLSPAQERRLPSAYRLVNGRLAAMNDEGPGDGDGRFRRGARYILPEAGIYATASDVCDFLQAMLDDRRGAGRLLRQDSMATMLAPRLPIVEPDGSARCRQALGWRIADIDGGSRASPMGRRGSFGHSGALGTMAWADPERDLVAVLMIQCLPATEARQDFARAVQMIGE